jgi:hypothetical protein
VHIAFFAICLLVQSKSSVLYSWWILQSSTKHYYCVWLWTGSDCCWLAPVLSSNTSSQGSSQQWQMDSSRHGQWRGWWMSTSDFSARISAAGKTAFSGVLHSHKTCWQPSEHGRWQWQHCISLKCILLQILHAWDLWTRGCWIFSSSPYKSHTTIPSGASQ